MEAAAPVLCGAGRSEWGFSVLLEDTPAERTLKAGSKSHRILKHMSQTSTVLKGLNHRMSDVIRD